MIAEILVDIFDNYGANAGKAWQQFVEQEQLTPAQAELFKQFAVELLAWNEKKNLTAITDFEILLADHFQDSLAVTKFVTFKSADSVCDVGSGGGFPGIPLKILYPELPVVLLEVNQKKVAFLEAMKKKLDLKNLEICSLDWRTFFRKAPYPITHFLARASLKPDELVRVFKQGSKYPNATLIYWASAKWQAGEEEKRYLVKEESYMVNQKKRRLIFFMAS